MILVILAGFIGLVYSVRRSLKDSRHVFVDNFFCGLFGFMFGYIAGMLIAFMLPMKLEDQKTIHSLGALQDNTGVHGSFFLGSGSVDSKQYYSYYSFKNGLYQLEQVEARRSYIRYTNGSPRLVVVKRVADELRDYPINAIAMDLELGRETYIFEVPTGSIINNYTLDAK